MRLMGTTSDNTLFIGDQLFTDVWGAKRLGIYCILSKPINPKEEIQIVLKRRLEKPVLKSYTKQDNVILIGFMGAGKTTIGEKLASRMNRRMIDTDAYIVAKEGMSINDIFASKGEEYFRELETNVIKELTKTTHNAIISTGGGMPLREENAKLLRKLGKVFYLKSEPGTVYERVRGSTDRPLLNVENPMERIVSLLNERNPKYKKASHVTIETDDKSVDEVVNIIYKSK
jgi:shikimate kinase